MLPPIRVLRSWTRQSYRQCTAGGGSTFDTFLEALEFEDNSAATAVGAGTVASTSRGDAAFNAAVSYSTSENGITQDMVAEGRSFLIDTYEASEAALIASGVATPTDEQIKTEMMDRLQPVTDYEVTFAGIRVCA